MAGRFTNVWPGWTGGPQHKCADCGKVVCGLQGMQNHHCEKEDRRRVDCLCGRTIDMTDYKCGSCASELSLNHHFTGWDLWHSTIGSRKLTRDDLPPAFRALFPAQSRKDRRWGKRRSR